MKILYHTGKINKMFDEVSYILDVETRSVFDHLIHHDFHDEFNCVIVTGCGYLEVATRVFTYKVWRNLEVHVYGLMDADPYDAQIFYI